MSMPSKLLLQQSLFKQLQSCRSALLLRAGRIRNQQKKIHQTLSRKAYSSLNSTYSIDRDMTLGLLLFGIVGATGTLSFASVTLTESSSNHVVEEGMEQLIAQWIQKSQKERENLMQQIDTMKVWSQSFLKGFVEPDTLEKYFPNVFIGDSSDKQSPLDESTDDAQDVPRFPSLAAHVVTSNGDLQEFQINSRNGIPIETDLFVGKMILVLVPSKGDDAVYGDTFLSDSIRFQLQLQGRFKRVPKGNVYCGAEITEKPNLDPVSKGVCTVLLQLLKTIGNNMHYSFGNQQELPHIVFPAWTAMDHVVVTKPGVTPPTLGEPFGEASAKKHTTVPTDAWNLNDTYSMSFSSARVDLPTWKMVNLGVIKDTSLEDYWGKAALRLVLYEKSGESSKHEAKENNYLMTLQMQFLGSKGEQVSTSGQ